jgi:hypothetical protein
MRQLGHMTPVLEAVLSKVTRVAAGEPASLADGAAGRLPVAQVVAEDHATRRAW